MSQFHPLLGAAIDDYSQIRFPVFASPKLDGIRAIWWGREFMSRSLKTIPNRFLQRLGAQWMPPARFDGELIVGEPNTSDVYRKTESWVMRHADPIPVEGVRFFIFDNVDPEGVFANRLDTLFDAPPLVVKLDQTLIMNVEEMHEYEENCITGGYEGVILRSPIGLYKHNRSTVREQYMLKLKRFKDAEARVVGFEELMHNANEATLDERGFTKRSSHQEGKIPMGVLGALVCELEGVEFRIGTGFKQLDRRTIWANRDQYLGKLAKFKSLPIGVKSAPRHPVWLGWRGEIDL